MKYYAGIGSRTTPASILKTMEAISYRLSNMGYCLRSGGAEGADTAFENCTKNKQIFLPWEGFNSKYSDNISYFVPPYDEQFVKRFHPRFNSLNHSSLKLMSRNTYQVLGPSLNDPVDFIICWTEDGKLKGGTAQAIRIAKHYQIPVFNLGSDGLKKLSGYILSLNKFIY